ncbi:hypothetical protein M3Y96_00845000 [Aphelenchoides besseyi]|nr:hypothetical protein M3Y96_00845000 [Aphelenchoides besseyi]
MPEETGVEMPQKPSVEMPQKPSVEMPQKPSVKMPQKISLNLQGKKIKVELSEGVLTQNTVKNAFMLPPDALVSLTYEDDGLNGCLVDKDGTFLLPKKWPNMEFLVKSDKVPRTMPTDNERPMTPIEIERANRVPKITSLWESRVFRMNGDKLTGSSVLINGQLVLTAAHLAFKLHKSYPIKGSNDRTFNVKCCFICKLYDFALLKSDDLPTAHLPVGSLDRGDKYFVMGYPSGANTSIPAISKGNIEGFMDDGIHLIGSPGSKRGYSGAPVFNVRGDLAGLLLGATTELNVNTTIEECLYSSAEQKYARILPISVAISRYNQRKFGQRILKHSQS